MVYYLLLLFLCPKVLSKKLFYYYYIYCRKFIYIRRVLFTLFRMIIRAKFSPLFQLRIKINGLCNFCGSYTVIILIETIKFDILIHIKPFLVCGSFLLFLCPKRLRARSCFIVFKRGLNLAPFFHLFYT